MELILDTNILFSIIDSTSAASYIFSLPKIGFFAPRHIQSELYKYEDDCQAKAQISEKEFEERWNEIESKVKFSPLSEYEPYLKEAIDSIPDPKDSPVLALALSKNKMPIWSNDPHPKQQSLVPVYTTKELLDILIKLKESELKEEDSTKE